MKWNRVILACLPALLFGAESASTRLQSSAEVLSEIMSAPDKGIPQELLDGAQCVAVVPGMKKGAFVVGAKFGKGFVTCHNHAGRGWSAPAAVKVEGGSFGFQIGGSETDVVMLIMNEVGAEKLMSDKFTLGADASVAAGPVGRTASADTDAKMRAEILTYSRARGAFAGIALDGATLRPDKETNAELYGNGNLTTKEIIHGSVTPPASAKVLTSELSKYSTHKQ
jgi:lipid-binding SYLF domain-containing protein